MECGANRERGEEVETVVMADLVLRYQNKKGLDFIFNFIDIFDLKDRQQEIYTHRQTAKISISCIIFQVPAMVLRYGQIQDPRTQSRSPTCVSSILPAASQGAH